MARLRVHACHFVTYSLVVPHRDLSHMDPMVCGPNINNHGVPLSRRYDTTSAGPTLDGPMMNFDSGIGGGAA